MTGAKLFSYSAYVVFLLAFANTVYAGNELDPDADRLTTAIQTLDNDPALTDLAGLERLKAKQSVTALQNARSRDREQALYLASRWVEAAQTAAQAELLMQQSAQLDRERDQIMLEASRRDAEMARREADRLRLQKLAQEEESQRLAEAAETERIASEQSTADAQATAKQARKLADARAQETQLARKEAELAAAVAADSMTDNAPLPPMHQAASGNAVYTLAGSAFASGSSTLTAAAQASVQRLAGVLKTKRSIRIEGHTDSQGEAAVNLALSQERANAVRRALVTGGVPASHIQAVGKGETDPLSDNLSTEGRARNRRVEIIVK